MPEKHKPSEEEIKKAEETTGEEKQMDGIRTKSTEQEDRLPSILIIYRDNDLFEKQIPEMERIFSAMGRKVEIKNFPRGTDKNEIEEWHKENIERLAGVEIISDTTAKTPHGLYKEFQSQGTKSIGDLDDLMKKATEKVIWGMEGGYDRYNAIGMARRPDLSEHQQLKECYSPLIKHVLESQENVPNKIYLFSDHIIDHANVGAYTGISYENELYSYLQSDFNHNFDGNPEYKKIKEEFISKYTEEIKELLVESSINNEKIVIKSERPSKQELQEIDQPGNWVIIDRHSDMFGGKEQITLANAKKLNLPEDSFFNSAREAGLIDIPNEEFVQKLEEIIKEKFGG